ncbi:MAG: hypothetical protein R3E86_21580 [Pseudomonadales bacterium]
MLGGYDRFDELTAHGRDHVRARRMMKLLAFSDRRKQLILDPPA